jgi:hypothetical protein
MPDDARGQLKLHHHPSPASTQESISPGLGRMAVGYTGTPEQRWGQLQAALAKVGLP